MAIGKVAREALDGVAPGDIKHLAAYLRTDAGNFLERFRDAAGVAPGQVDDIGGVEAAGQLLGQGKAQIARRARDQSYLVHGLIDINILIRVKRLEATSWPGKAAVCYQERP